jgi:hypothetical protein
MTPIEFKGAKVVFAKNQHEYLPLPAHYPNDLAYPMTCCWQLSWKERFQLFFLGKIWHQIHTFGEPLQPQILHTKKPELLP